MNVQDRIIVALDTDDPDEAIDIVYDLKDFAGMFKVGSELFTSNGPLIVERIVSAGLKVFLDLKYHDTPNTVSKSVAEAAKLGVDLISVHLSSGEKCLKAAMANKGRSRLFGVTVPTSIGEDECYRIYGRSREKQVFHLGLLAANSGLDGVICAGNSHEAGQIKQDPRFQNLQILCPGIRLSSDQKHDQYATVDPIDAIKNGADYIVLGRTITQHRHTAAHLGKKEIINAMIKTALKM